MRFELLSYDSVTFGLWDHHLSKVVGNGKGGQWSTTDRAEAEKAAKVMNERVAGL